MKLYLPKESIPKKRIKLRFGTGRTGNFNPYVREDEDIQQSLFSTKSRNRASRASHAAPSGLCPTCWQNRVVAPLNGPTCPHGDFTWPGWEADHPDYAIDWN